MTAKDTQAEKSNDIVASSTSFDIGQLTKTLYAYLLGRQPEKAAYEAQTTHLRNTGDWSVPLHGILQSEEFKLHHPQAALSALAHHRLQRKPRIVDVGAQSRAGHIYAPVMRYCDVEILGFDPLEERLNERKEEEANVDLTLLPYAVGDGGLHTLYINNDDATSSLYPLNTEGNAPFPLLSQLHTVRTEELRTRRLDDLVTYPEIDFLKLDIQGGELLVLKSATETLKRTAVIHSEVEFSPIYSGQPLFGEMCAFLAEHGFYFLDFSFLGRYSPETKIGFQTGDRLMWADAVFLKSETTPEQRAAQALFLAQIYQKYALADYLLNQ